MTLQTPEKNRPCHRTGSADRSRRNESECAGSAFSVVKLQEPAAVDWPAEACTVYRVAGSSGPGGSM